MDWVSLKPLLWLLLLIPLLGVFKYSLVDRPRLYKWLAIALRMAAMLLVVLAICRPFMATDSENVHLAFVLDVSESVDLQDARAAVDRIEVGINQLSPADSWSLLVVGSEIKMMSDTAEAATLLDQWISGLPDNDFRNASLISEALLASRLYFPANKARRIVLFSDGRPTHEALEGVLDTLAQEHIDLRWQRLKGLQQAEVCVASLMPSTTTAFEGEMVRLTTTLHANRKLPATLRILHKAVVVTHKELVLEPDTDNVVHMEVPMTTPGPSQWTAELVAEQDYFLINNKADCTVTVSGKPRVLVLHEDTRKMRSFRKALLEQDVEVDLRGKHGLPEDLAALLAFEAVILADIAATDMSPGQMELLKRYVIDFGGGLAMFGSNNSFGLGGYYKTPVEEVLPLTSRYEKEKEQPSVAMALVIDKSGSMSGMPIDLARQAAKAAVDLMGKQDYIGVVGFDGQAFITSPMRSVMEGEVVKDAINTLEAGGGTNMYPGMEAAFSMLETVAAKIKHVIILSDGQSQPGDFEGLVSNMADAGITVSTVALGNADRALLSSLAEIGRGRYYETADPTNIPKIFTKETVETSRSAVKEDLFDLVVTSDHPLLSGFNDGELPVIFGYVMTHVKPATQLLLVADSGDPVMAVARYGLGTSLAYTCDVTNNWGSQWLVWAQFGRFWSQAIRGILRRQSAEGMTLQQRHRHGTWTVDILRHDASGHGLKGIDFDAQVVDETGTTRAVTVEETGLGRYRMSVLLSEARTMSLRLVDRDYDKMAMLHYNRPYPAEYNLGAQAASCIADIPPLNTDALIEDLEPVAIRKPVSHLCYLAALVLMAVGLLFRRI
jgi:Ca-activated chloride channel homolog